MSVIQQMYCTHCTHGSSALERRQGEIAARMLGYSVRASSLQGDALRQAYRQVERYASYHLPKDTPGEQKLQLTATSAPQRLIFIPTAGTWQVIAHVCYRQRDTEGRPGSYFAHLLCREAGAKEPWTLLDALRLWQAPQWVTEDSSDHPFVLPALDSLDSLLDQGAPLIDDRSLLAFLHGDDRSFGDRLPDRWRDLVPSRRVEILQSLLDALLTIGTTRRQALLVAIEPEMAALFFYAVGRLLPPGTLRASVSMSTFEAAADRLTTILAATTFSDPATAEFRTEALRGRGIALNTFADAPSDANAGTVYGERIVRRFLEEGPEAADHHLAMVAACGPDRIETLQDFANTERAIETLFHPGGKSPSPWRAASPLTDFARRLVCERLEGLHGAESTLSGLRASPKLVTILELAGTIAPGTGIDRAFEYLLNNLAEEKVAAFVGNPDIHDAWKVMLLDARIASTGRTPTGCEWIWAEPDADTPLEAGRRKFISMRLLGSLRAKAVVSLLRALEDPQRVIVVAGLLDVCDECSDRWPVFAEVARQLNIDTLITLRKELGARFFEVPSAAGEALADRLREILNTLHENSAEFPQRLDFLEAGMEWLSDSSDSKRVAAWVRCREAMVELIRMKDLGGLNRLTATRRLELAAQRMTEAALEAMPPDLLADDRQGSVKLERLRAIGRTLAGEDEFLPARQWQYEALWKKIGWRIEMGSWSSAPLHKMAKGPANRRQLWIAAAVAAAVLVAVLGVIGLATIGTGGTSQTLVVERGDGQEASEPAAPQGRPEDSQKPEPDGPSNGALSEAPLPNVPQPPTAVPVDSAPIVFRRESSDTNAEPITPPSGKEPLGEMPVVPIEGTFAAEMSPVAGLKPPAVALVALYVHGVNGGLLPEWVSTRYTIGAVVKEQSDSGVIRYLDFADLSAKNEAELFDGVEKVLVQFRFASQAASPTSEPSEILALSYSWAEVPIQPSQRYDIRFALSPSAFSELERLAPAGE